MFKAFKYNLRFLLKEVELPHPLAMADGLLKLKNGPDSPRGPKPLNTLDLPYSHIKRLERIADYCSMPSRVADEHRYREVYKFTTPHNNFYFKKFNISYCKVPKVGCTFMMQMFDILTHGTTDLSNTPRVSIHKSTRLYKNNDLKGIPTLSAARDPYSRLYSAYVDKLVLPNIYMTNLKIRNIAPKQARLKANGSNSLCASNITFQEFLDYVIVQAKGLTNDIMNMHWAPIYSICNFCETNNYIIVKQESFSDDALDFINTLEVSNTTVESVRALLTSKRIETTISGIVPVVLENQPMWKGCLKRMLVLEKLWLSFQIQGYISANRPFPTAMFMDAVKTDIVKAQVISDLLVQAAKDSNLTKSESKAQRHSYLVRAYTTISPSTLEIIKDIFRTDFKIFDYDMTPPSFS